MAKKKTAKKAMKKTAKKSVKKTAKKAKKKGVVAKLTKGMKDIVAFADHVVGNPFATRKGKKSAKKKAKK